MNCYLDRQSTMVNVITRVIATPLIYMGLAVRPAMALVLGLSLSPCGVQQVANYDFTEFPSPDGKHVAAWYVRDAGATTREATALAIFKTDQDRAAAAQEPVVVIDGRLNPLPELKWNGPDNLNVVFLATQKRDAVFEKATTAAGVTVAYSY